MPYLIFVLHTVALILAPGTLRWVLAPMWGAAAALAYFKPDDRPAVINYDDLFLASTQMDIAQAIGEDAGLWNNITDRGRKLGLYLWT